MFAVESSVLVPRAWASGYDEPEEYCADRGAEIFRSEAKSESGAGWSSFRPASAEDGRSDPERMLFMRRPEVLSVSCRAHVCRVFPAGPRAGGRRHCISSVPLELDRAEGA